ncbi:hypothetical protein BpHYR1_030474 [Brachionus plicatilis]|uniref:Uncharacterized protein n=1 Tax=Brachionus plicatilis TaxID=10195 RepID=A0A3M7PBA0_BRAPC|nr:hypothetical protein BpHYR1_030474 [Brachionus plicatilis]
MGSMVTYVCAKIFYLTFGAHKSSLSFTRVVLKSQVKSKSNSWLSLYTSQENELRKLFVEIPC